MKKQKQTQKEINMIEAVRYIKDIAKKCKDHKLTATVKSVSASGMSRRVKFYAMTKNGAIYNLTYKVAQSLGYRYNYSDETVTIGGCGMDVIFNSLYNINYIALNYGIVKTNRRTNRDRHTVIYNGAVNTYYNMI